MALAADRALVVTVVGLAVADVVRATVVPNGWQLAFNVALTVAVAFVARAAELDRVELGLVQWDAGLRLGALVGGAIAAVVVGAAVVAPDWSVFADDRVDVGLGRALLTVLVVIPVGTVVLEELAFRGVVLGLMRRRGSDARAVAVTSVVFGAWHVPGVWTSGVGVVAATVLATTAAGVGFAWLRLRCGSLLAPALVHVATNSIPYATAWTLAHR